MEGLCYNFYLTYRRITMQINSEPCELVNTYEILEHIFNIKGLHPHSLSSIDSIYEKIAIHTKHKKGVILDVGCGSGFGTYRLSLQLPQDISIIGIDINKISIEKAQLDYKHIDRLSFHEETLESFYRTYPDTIVIGIVAISVSMFIPDILDFYKTSYQIMEDDGIFIDAPFAFESTQNINNLFKQKTYNICGCNMNMYTTKYLSEAFNLTGFEEIDLQNLPFELMNFSTLSKEYGLMVLCKNFIKNILYSPKILNRATTYYLIRRVINIFYFFLKNKRRFNAAIIQGIKPTSS